jgi:hypothetical protein
MFNESNIYLPLLHHKTILKHLYSFLKIIKTAVRLGRDDQAASDGYDGALLTFHMSVIYGPPAKCNRQLYSWLYYTHGPNNEHPCVYQHRPRKTLSSINNSCLVERFFFFFFFFFFF